MQVGVIGAGSWGTTVANLSAQNSPTRIWARRSEICDSINSKSTNPRYLGELPLHPSLTASTSLAEVVENADVVVIGVATTGYPETLNALAPLVRSGTPVISLAKGLDTETGRRMTQLATDLLPGSPVGVLSGPNLAREILAGKAAASVIAFEDLALAQQLQHVFSSELFRVYTNSDVIGCELGGALKNVVAFAAGVADGLSAGDNARAAVITRGLSEISRLGVALGGRHETFAGLTGMGDLIATSISPHSRNRSAGFAFGRGQPLAEVIAEMDQVIEGIQSAPVAARLAQQHGIEMPITEQIRAVIEDGRTAADVYRGLLQRPL